MQLEYGGVPIVDRASERETHGRRLVMARQYSSFNLLKYLEGRGKLIARFEFIVQFYRVQRPIQE